jgi:putative ABC transport system permease protein
MRNWIDDLRHGLRALRRNPGFALGAILVLALGIGANTSIFSIVNAALLRPLPYQDPSRLMQVWHVPPAKSFPGLTLFSVSPANYLDWQRQSTSFASMAAYGGRTFTFGGAERPEAIQGATVAPDFFSVLGTRPMLGRTFAPDENLPGSTKVIVLSYKFWRDHFGSDRSIVGRDITINSQPYSVAGVMPEVFRMPGWAQVWVPLGWTNEERMIRGNHNYMVIARLKSGVDIHQAQAELAGISTRLEQQYPEDDKGWGATAVPLREQLVGDIRPALLVLLGAVVFVLLIACANVANLVLAKTLARRKEIAIRTALGAGRAAIVRHLLAETMVLSVAGGALGLLLASVSIRFMVKILADRLPSFVEVTLDTPVLAFTLVLSIAAGMLAGLIPSLRFTRTDVNEALKTGQGRGSSDASGGKTRNLLVVSEVALSLVLLIGAGLMVRTLWELRSVNPGFDSANVLTMTVAIPRDRFSSPAGQINFFQEVLQRTRALPGVDSAGVIDTLPLDSEGGSHQPFSIEGRPVVPMAEQPEVDIRLISPGYLHAMHVPIIRGRDFSDADAAGRPGAALISDTLARRYWPNEDPIGKHLTLTFSSDIVREIVGIVGNVKLDSLNETRPVDTIYVALAQLKASPGDWHSFGLTLAVRTNSDPHSAISAVSDAIHQVGPDIPIVDVLSMDDVIAQSMSPQRFNLVLLSSFAGLALLLAAVGIYGVLSYTVRRRVREIGIRMALGASQSAILKMVVTDGMKPILIGVAIGIGSALVLTRLIASLIFGVRPTDPFTFFAVALILVTVGIIANSLPAYRATRIEPVRTLRDE